MRRRYRKLPFRFLLGVLLLLLAIEAASFCSWSVYHTPRITCQFYCGRLFVLVVGGDRNLEHMGWSAAPSSIEPLWIEYQFPSWTFIPGYRCVEVPLWPFILAAAGAAFWVHRRSRPRPGHCPECRYDLRATPPSPSGARTCPECGTLST